MRKNNRRRSLVGAFLMLLILVSGTFAAFQFNQGAFNPVRLVETFVGRLHDDFQDIDGPGPIDKDIYAENFGALDLMVRVRFREFLQLEDDIVGGDTVDISDHTTWPVARFDGFDYEYTGEYTPGLDSDGEPMLDGDGEPVMVPVRRLVPLRYEDSTSYEIGNHIGWNLGNPAGADRVFMPTHNQVGVSGTATVDPEFNDGGDLQGPLGTTVFGWGDLTSMFRFSNTTGRAAEAIIGANGGLVGTAETIYDFFNNSVQTGSTESDGSHGFWSLGDEYEAYLFYVNAANMITLYRDANGDPVQVAHVAQNRLAVTVNTDSGDVNDPNYIPGLVNGIISVDDWLAAGAPHNRAGFGGSDCGGDILEDSCNFWIMDTDGWFYWAGYLYGSNTRNLAYDDQNLDEEYRLPTVATSLLLNGIVVPPHHDLSYVIHVDAQWFTMPQLAGLYTSGGDAHGNTTSSAILEGFDPQPVLPMDPEETLGDITITRLSPEAFADFRRLTVGEAHTFSVDLGYADADGFSVLIRHSGNGNITNANLPRTISGNTVSFTITDTTMDWLDGQGHDETVIIRVTCDESGETQDFGPFNIQ